MPRKKGTASYKKELARQRKLYHYRLTHNLCTICSQGTFKGRLCKKHWQLEVQRGRERYVHKGYFHVPMIGRRFGYLLVIARAEKTTQYKQKTIRYTVKCDCGKTKDVFGHSLRQGFTRSCGCHQLDKIRKAPGESARNIVLWVYKRNAKVRGLCWELTIPQFFALSQRDCYYCGRGPSTLEKTNNGNFLYNGIDRKNREEGYTLGNSVPCCNLCNLMKMKLSTADFLFQIERIASFQRKRV